MAKNNEDTKKQYSVDQIKLAFWESFDGMGEIWFGCFEDEDEDDEFSTIDTEWSDFLSILEETPGG